MSIFGGGGGGGGPPPPPPPYAGPPAVSGLATQAGLNAFNSQAAQAAVAGDIASTAATSPDVNAAAPNNPDAMPLTTRGAVKSLLGA